MHEIKEINGIRIAVNTEGNGQPMILIHGKGYSKEMMGRIADHYRDSYQTYRYDVRGHGESDKPESFTLEDDVEDLKCLIDACDINKPVVFGFSMGSYIALKTVETYPELFSKIVLVGTKGGGDISSSQKIMDDADAAGLTPEQRVERMVRKVFAPQVTFEDIAAYDREIESPVKLTEADQNAINKSLQNFDLILDAHKVKVPVLVMTGEYDGLNLPTEGRRVAEALPNARFEIIPNAGHIAFFENPERVLALTDEFLQEK